jgi:hypothetical protein
MTQHICVFSVVKTTILFITGVIMMIPKTNLVLKDTIECETKYVSGQNIFITPTTYDETVSYFTIRTKGSFSPSDLDMNKLLTREVVKFCVTRTDVKILIHNACFSNELRTYDFCVIEKSISSCPIESKNTTFFNDPTADILIGDSFVFPAIGKTAIFDDEIMDPSNYYQQFNNIKNDILNFIKCANNEVNPAFINDKGLFMTVGFLISMFGIMTLIETYMVHVQIRKINTKIRRNITISETIIGHLPKTEHDKVLKALSDLEIVIHDSFSDTASLISKDSVSSRKSLGSRS